MKEARRLAERYRLDGVLGSGGMSQVYYGHDERLDRRVAIKILRQTAPGLGHIDPDSPEAAEILDAQRRDRKRFLREIRTTAQLEHPGTPAVYDTGEETAPDGTTELWLVMQLLGGSTLQTILGGIDYDAAPPGLTWAAAITAQIAAVLADVHRVDMVHRDIKPANAMIVDGGFVKVLDFGIAILRGGAALPRLTQVDRTVGTPAYMSPEQCLGRPVTSASDIYSLGCLLYELVTGDVPFHGTTNAPLRVQHLEAAPPLMKVRRANVPETFESILASMLAKEPEDRPSAESVYDTFLPFATAAAESPESDEGRDPTRPFRRPLLGVARRREIRPDRPALTETEANRLRDKVQGLLDGDRLSEAIRLLEDGVQRTSQGSVLELHLSYLLGAALFYSGEYTRAASLFDAVGRDYRHLLAPSDPQVLDCAYYAGHAYAEIGKPDKSLPQLRFFIQNYDPSTDSDGPEKVLETRFVIAQMLATLGEVAEALAELEAVRVLVAESFGDPSTQLRNLDKQIARLRSITR